MERKLQNYPQISILIPTYNRAGYLAEAIESALDQDYPNLEVIVSDNASTDGTEKWVQKYSADSRFRYFRNETNLGSGPNYRKLLYVYATGEYGHFLTDDDYFIDREYLKKGMEIIRKYHVRAVFAAADSRYRDERKGRSLSLDLNEVISREWWLENLCKTKGGLTYFPSCGSGTLFQVDLAKKLRAFEGTPYGDYEFGTQCILSDPYTGYIKEPQYVERRHEEQDGRTSYANALAGTMMFHRIYEYGRRLNIDPKVMEEIKFRGFKYLIRGWLLHNWVIENGNSLASMKAFWGELRKIDPKLPPAALKDLNIVVQFVFYNTSIYLLLKRVYLKYRAWFQKK